MGSYDDAGIRSRLRDSTDDTIGPNHMDRMMEKVIQRAERTANMKRNARRTGFFVGGAALLLLILLMVPMSRTVCIGSIVTVEWETPTQLKGVDLEERIDEISSALGQGEGISLAEVGLKDSRMVARVVFHDLDASGAEQRVQAMLQDIGCTLNEVSLATRNVTRSVGGSALASVAGIFIQIKTNGLSEEEIAAAIDAELAEYGDFESQLRIRTEGDQQIIDISIEGEAFEDGDGEDGEQTITIELMGEDE